MLYKIDDKDLVWENVVSFSGAKKKFDIFYNKDLNLFRLYFENSPVDDSVNDDSSIKVSNENPIVKYLMENGELQNYLDEENIIEDIATSEIHHPTIMTYYDKTISNPVYINKHLYVLSLRYYTYVNTTEYPNVKDVTNHITVFANEFSSSMATEADGKSNIIFDGGF